MKERGKGRKERMPITYSGGRRKKKKDTEINCSLAFPRTVKNPPRSFPIWGGKKERTVYVRK